MELTIEDVLSKYKVEEINQQKLLKEIFDTILYLDNIVVRLRQDPVGKHILKKIESDIESEMEINFQVSDTTTDLNTFFVIFKDVVGFKGKYTEILALDQDNAEKQAEVNYPDLWKVVESSKDKILNLTKF